MDQLTQDILSSVDFSSIGTFKKSLGQYLSNPLNSTDIILNDRVLWIQLYSRLGLSEIPFKDFTTVSPSSYISDAQLFTESESPEDVALYGDYYTKFWREYYYKSSADETTTRFYSLDDDSMQLEIVGARVIMTPNYLFAVYLYTTTVEMYDGVNLVPSVLIRRGNKLFNIVSLYEADGLFIGLIDGFHHEVVISGGEIHVSKEQIAGIPGYYGHYSKLPMFENYVFTAYDASENMTDTTVNASYFDNVMQTSYANDLFYKVFPDSGMVEVVPRDQSFSVKGYSLRISGKFIIIFDKVYDLFTGSLLYTAKYEVMHVGLNKSQPGYVAYTK